ncbi:MAG TPA: YicC/YloC family endoribonuclease [Flavobacteriaceae bacterium]|nr:YicC/YloC family endoribonuclease [Flavobacteriaceae bacterium]
MIQSMTGFGKSLLSLPTKKITLEIKSLNSKNLDLNARIPSQYREKELDFRNLIADSLVRGKVDFTIHVESTGTETATEINKKLVKKYMDELSRIVKPGESQQMDLLKMAIELPEALTSKREKITKSEYDAIQKSLKEALKNLNDFRTAEGKALEKDLQLRTKNLKNLLKKVGKIDPERIKGVRERLHKHVAELKETIDENRFEQELVYYIEKFDISEEKTRLENHLDYFAKNLKSKDSNGKKLGFISQEMGREINTIGSKSNYAPMQQLVVQMKDELEKIKEQLLNVL